MIPHVTEARPLEDHRLRLRFDDGTEGVVDIAARVRFVGVFEPLASLENFRRVRVDSEAGTVVWPNGADLDPVVLYAAAHGTSPEEVLRRPAAATGR